MPRIPTLRRRPTPRPVLALAAALLAGAAAFAPALSSAQAAAATAPSASATARDAVRPADPRPEDSNAVRAVTQPGNNAPFWRAVRDSGERRGVSNLPGAEKGVLVQEFVRYPGSRTTNAGEAWRQVRNQWIIPYGGALLVIAALAIGIFYFVRGPIGGHVPYTGRLIERFTPFERAAHWANATAFVTLAISGIVMAFGKFFLLPVMGRTLFGGLTYFLKTLHNFMGPLFAVSLLIIVVTFIRDNLPQRGDLRWLLSGGGLFGGRETPSHRFNAGEKVMFWIAMLGLGAIVVGSGLVLDRLVPGVGLLRGDMQVAHMIHASAAALMMAMLAGHIYLGTVGTRDAFRAMRTGYVDEGWAQEHHGHWADGVRAGRIPAKRSAEPLPGSVPTAPGASAQRLPPLGVAGAGAPRP